MKVAKVCYKKRMERAPSFYIVDFLFIRHLSFKFKLSTKYYLRFSESFSSCFNRAEYTSSFIIHQDSLILTFTSASLTLRISLISR